jgi:hypothetical protein
VLYFSKTIAKNHLSEIDPKELNLLVEQCLVFAESQALAQRTRYMADWIKKLSINLPVPAKLSLIPIILLPTSTA